MTRAVLASVGLLILLCSCDGYSASPSAVPTAREITAARATVNSATVLTPVPSATTLPEATVVVATPTALPLATPAPSTIGIRLMYPSDHIPPASIYFVNTVTGAAKHTMTPLIPGGTGKPTDYTVEVSASSYVVVGVFVQLDAGGKRIGVERVADQKNVAKAATFIGSPNQSDQLVPFTLAGGARQNVVVTLSDAQPVRDLLVKLGENLDVPPNAPAPAPGAKSGPTIGGTLVAQPVQGAKLTYTVTLTGYVPSLPVQLLFGGGEANVPIATGTTDAQGNAKWTAKIPDGVIVCWDPTTPHGFAVQTLSASGSLQAATKPTFITNPPGIPAC